MAWVDKDGHIYMRIQMMLGEDSVPLDIWFWWEEEKGEWAECENPPKMKDLEWAHVTLEEDE